jgi:hypothetical protein
VRNIPVFLLKEKSLEDERIGYKLNFRPLSNKTDSLEGSKPLEIGENSKYSRFKAENELYVDTIT